MIGLTAALLTVATAAAGCGSSSGKSSAGGNTINGVFFSYQNPDAQTDAARRDAISNARHRAELYASALNMRVVRIVAVTEGGSYSPPVPMPMVRMAAAQDATPVQVGEVDTTANINVTFELR